MRFFVSMITVRRRFRSRRSPFLSQIWLFYMQIQCYKRPLEPWF